MNLDRFPGVNAGYVFELYEKYRHDPGSVDPATRRIFEAWTPTDTGSSAAAPAATPETLQAAVGTANLAECIRRYGHLAARVDPLGSMPIGDPALSPEAHGLTEANLIRLPASLVGGPVVEGAANALDAIEKLRQIYCSTTGYDIAHVFVPEERVWLREAIEQGRFRPALDDKSGVALLDRLTQVEVFERFLHRTFPGKTRFSVEGLDMLVPVLDEILCGAADQGIRHTMLGMAHRGRLNVLAHVLDKPYAQILAEFKDPVQMQTWRVDLGWMGDVKYHSGARTEAPGGEMFVAMASNPSHLEAVDPVVVGMARAAGTNASSPGAPTFDGGVTLPILIHGDAAFPGQGIVAETLNLSRLAGYDTGGTLHIIANNQLGFTATPAESYSTSYTSGVARGFKIPVVHVNADDPVACLEAARLCWEYRERFRRDFLIDLVGYRRYGHNEGDEPAFTQPVMYKAVNTHPTVRELLAQSLVKAGRISPEIPDRLVKQHFATLEKALAELKPEEDYIAPIPEPVPPGIAGKTNTGVALERLREINDALIRVPNGFSIHKKLERAREKRSQALANPAERTVDWATAEELALATVLADGIPIRLTGEDVERGTFSHRHAVFHDANTGKQVIALQELPQARAAFEVHNTPLTENATVGFEFGYNIQAPERLVILGSPVRRFHQRRPGDTRPVHHFRPRQVGPEAVARLPAAARLRGPGPRALERTPGAHSPGRGGHQPAARELHHRGAVLPLAPPPGASADTRPASALRAHAKEPLEASRRRVRSPGSHGGTLPIGHRRRRGAPESENDQAGRAVQRKGVRRPRRQRAACRREGHRDVRVEQLYPFPGTALREVLAQYTSVRDVVWLQEEPENVGAWEFMRPLLDESIGDRCPLRYIGRARSASPSEGSAAWHQLNQKALVAQAFDLDSHASETWMVLSKPVRSLK